MALQIDTVEVPFAIPDPQRQNKATLQHFPYRLRVFDRALGLLGPAAGRRYVDLGAGPLLFSQRARKAGYAVTAVDARPPWLGAMPRDMAYVCADIRSYPLEGFDVIGIVGLLYHLRLAEQIDLLRRCAGRPTIIDTEVWNAAVVREAGSDTRRLHPVADHLGYAGAAFDENAFMWSSVGNPDSFWLDEPSLLRLIEECGWQRAALLEPPYLSAFGRRRWYVLT
jgi:SAM-dependent methyltransferase